MEERRLRFPSEDWMKRYVEVVNASKEYAEAARDWEGDVMFIITPDEGYKSEEVYWLDLYHGKVRDWKRLSSREEKSAEFVYEGPYGNWVKLIRGEIDPIRGALTGKFRLRGNMMKILRYARAAQELVNCARKVPSEFA
jgi:putative sterol carrier protein